MVPVLHNKSLKIQILHVPKRGAQHVDILYAQYLIYFLRLNFLQKIAPRRKIQLYGI